MHCALALERWVNYNGTRCMNMNDGLRLIAPRITPVLDPSFRPAVLANRAFRDEVGATNSAVPVRIALEQADGSVFQFQTEVLPAGHPQAGANFIYIERMIKFLLWSRGGFRIYLDGPAAVGERLQKHYKETPTGKFDSEIIGNRIYDRPIEVVLTKDIPATRSNATPLGRHLDGCRIGFDLGGSDRKVAAIVNGQAVYSEEVVWDPYFQKDPQYHYQGIMESLKSAARHMPRVDAIGGSAAGVYVNNRVKVASLFRGIAPDVFEKEVKGMFLKIQQDWGNIPLEVVNDGEVTALAGSISLKQNGVLGISLGTSTAGGYVNMDGNITSWLNELAFVPVDYNPASATDEWSGDYGCGVQYFSQQAVGRLMGVSGIEAEAEMPLPEKLQVVQSLMYKEDYRANKIYQTIGTYLGYAIAHYADFYDLKNVLILGRVTSGPGGELIINGAKEVLKLEFSDLAERINFHIPSEKDKRHGQAVAAASLPKLKH
jgi:predicted NBD/HSP70 family sugar kinase